MPAEPSCSWGTGPGDQGSRRRGESRRRKKTFASHVLQCRGGWRGVPPPLALPTSPSGAPTGKKQIITTRRDEKPLVPPPRGSPRGSGGTGAGKRARKAAASGLRRRRVRPPRREGPGGAAGRTGERGLPRGDPWVLGPGAAGNPASSLTPLHPDLGRRQDQSPSHPKNLPRVFVFPSLFSASSPCCWQLSLTGDR